jgi:hypothetical protein
VLLVVPPLVVLLLPEVVLVDVLDVVWPQPL